MGCLQVLGGLEAAQSAGVGHEEVGVVEGVLRQQARLPRNTVRRETPGSPCAKDLATDFSKPRRKSVRLVALRAGARVEQPLLLPRPFAVLAEFGHDDPGVQARPPGRGPILAEIVADVEALAGWIPSIRWSAATLPWR